MPGLSFIRSDRPNRNNRETPKGRTDSGLCLDIQKLETPKYFGRLDLK